VLSPDDYSLVPQVADSAPDGFHLVPDELPVASLQADWVLL
jgi:hypothetical protein